MERMRKIMETVFVSIIVFYQRFVSPLKGRTCRFYPTCSDYAIQSVKKYGIIKGIGKSLIRIAKCHPFHPGGYDPV
ncbi:MAG: membrane protein insertion efficiency factor YidD [Dehalobacter sp. 4CP]|uniref:membrane protein insertion efficiency factor YidD n=1 Tax=Dehalobacter sp. CP TaxID=2594474 RepID=UPI00028AF1EC|nr:Protein YidD [Dehalobacter sp. DCA]AFV06985.1 Protein YidD [Dehalobacter sp. CF]EQB22490.1 Protein YidD [Dehalobacter sp. UNSWDHB]NBJ15775.1 membrane protein insertion efficiency factor YidD [Dehalobacter sp. 4CP]